MSCNQPSKSKKRRWRRKMLRLRFQQQARTEEQEAFYERVGRMVLRPEPIAKVIENA